MRLKNVASVIVWVTFGFSIVALGTFLILRVSERYQHCIEQGQQKAEQISPQNQVTNIVAAFVIGKSCFGDYVQLYAPAITVILTLVLAAATIGLWGVTWSGILRQREETRILQRAFVFVSKFNLDIVKGPDDRPNWWISVDWHNGGNTQTVNFFNRINAKTFVGEPTEAFTFPDQSQTEAMRGVIGPKGTETSAIIKISFDTIQAIISGQRRLFVWGWAEYDDILRGRPHRTEFCDEVVIESGFPIRRMYRLYNGADGECSRKARRAAKRSQPIT